MSEKKPLKLWKIITPLVAILAGIIYICVRSVLKTHAPLGLLYLSSVFIIGAICQRKPEPQSQPEPVEEEPERSVPSTSSSADLHIYDPIGRHTGVDYDKEQIENQIPESSYKIGEISTNEDGTFTSEQKIEIPKLAPGEYHIETPEPSSGEFHLDIEEPSSAEEVEAEPVSQETVSSIVGAIDIKEEPIEETFTKDTVSEIVAEEPITEAELEPEESSDEEAPADESTPTEDEKSEE